MKRFACFLILSVMCLPLASCSMLEKDTVVKKCPQTGYLKNADKVTVINDNNKITTRGAFADLKGGCNFHKSSVIVRFDLAVYAERLGVNRDDEGNVRLPYFVAVLDPDGQPIARQEFVAELEFAENQTGQMRVEELQQKIPLQNIAHAGDYKVLVGFELSPEQYEYNMKGL